MGFCITLPAGWTVEKDDDDVKFEHPDDSSQYLVVSAPDGTLARVHEIAATATPNMTFSADGKTMYVMAVDNTAGAPYEGRVLAVGLQ